MKFFISVSALLVGVLIVTQLPVVTGINAGEVAHAVEQLEPVELSGKTLFISDLHLRYGPIKEQFNLDFSSVQNVVIVGDFFDSPRDFARFGKTQEESLRKVLADLVPSGFSGKIFFIQGESHDPTLANISRLSFEHFDFINAGKYGKFDVNGVPVVAFHGNELYGGIAGGGISWLAQKFGYPLALERLGRKRFRIDEHTWIVAGHSHVPAINQESKIANTGSFAGVPFNFFFRIHAGTGILFDEGKVQLIQFENF